LSETKSSSPRKLALNFMLLSGGEAISKIFAFISFAYLARLLGPDSYGDIEFALAVTLFFNLVVEGGLGLLGAREIAKDEKSTLRFTFHIVIMRCFLALGAFLLLALFVIVSNKTWQESQLVLLYGLTLFGTPGLLQWVFQGLDRMKWVAISSVMRWSFFAGLVLLFVFNPGQVWLVPLIELGAIVCVVAFNLGVFRYFFGRFWQRFDVPFALSIFRQSLPIGLTQIMWGLKMYLPTIMLGLIVGGGAVGWFGAAHRIVIAVHTFVWMYYFNFYPSISRCSQQTTDNLQRLVGKSIQLTSWSAVFIGTTGILLAQPIMNFVYGPNYGEAAICFQALIWLAAFTLISGHYMYILIAYNKQWLELLSAICGAVINILLNFFFILRFGFLGAAFALLFSEAMIWALNYYFVRRYIANVSFLHHLAKPLIAGVVMAALILIMPPVNFLIMGIASVLLYGLGILILQPAIINDVRVLIAGNR